MRRPAFAAWLVILAIGGIAWFVRANRSDRAGSTAVEPPDVVPADGAAGVPEPELSQPDTTIDRESGSEVGVSPARTIGMEHAATVPRARSYPDVDLPRELNPMTFALPSTLDRWLAHPVLNSEGFVACDARADEQYAELVNGMHALLTELQSDHSDLRRGVGARKVRESADPATPGADLPADAILRFTSTQIENGAISSAGATFVRRGDSPELDAVDFDLRVLVADFVVQSRRIASNGCTK